jgi:hypothetical protein
MWLVRVELPWACFGVEVINDSWVTEGLGCRVERRAGRVGLGCSARGCQPSPTARWHNENASRSTLAGPRG